ncbi:sensor histidine kinase [Amorphoplanes digitatis]|uniref:histidine kinase n=1 Tax=Actinoplanes digitatis TaxID=1868 RepID=A0A7W7HU83_9ACTN|nr:histidine kinase [Actinoplanes digitatis]MBB4760918.1 signal transduction histidine kinase [Actinoplanes digitatis]
MGWVGRLFDARDTFVRMLLLDLSGISYLLFGTQAGREPTTTQWVLAVIAFVLALVLHRRRVLNLVAQTVLLVLAFRLIDDTMINQVGTSWALLELAMWAPRPRILWSGAGLVTAVYLAFTLGRGPSPISAPILGICVVVGVPVLLGLVVRTTRELGIQAQERALEEQRRRESESRAARADERAAIARELHDVVAHHVASMVLRVGVARHVLPDADPRVAEVFDDVHGTGTAALADLRRLVAVLRDPSVRTDAALTAIEPGALPEALAAAVETARRAGLTVDVALAPEVGTLDSVRGLAVLRLTQEALTNVAKHAGTAARARLRATVVDGDLIWSVSDDGGGVSPGLPSGGGHGLTGMRERVEVLGGRLTAGPVAGGWRVETVLPAVQPPADTPPLPAPGPA